MPLQRMIIKNLVVGGGPIASLVVLSPRDATNKEAEVELPIKVGYVEAASISMAAQAKVTARPLTHDLLAQSIEALGGKLKSVRIMDVEGTTFFAQLELVAADGKTSFVDARPSDALALALRCHAPIYASEKVLAAASLPDFRGVEAGEKRRELAEFHRFVEKLSPDDFKVGK